jgi:hypothetical protein
MTCTVALCVVTSEQVMVPAPPFDADRPIGLGRKREVIALRRLCAACGGKVHRAQRLPWLARRTLTLRCRPSRDAVLRCSRNG